MKISEYAQITKFTEDNILLVDGNAGTKKILASDAILAGLTLNSIYNKRAIFRGKNLGSTLTAEQKTAIQTGTFENLWLGDYWEIDGVKYRIADFDYWHGRGDTPFNTHHLVIVPDDVIGQAKMNDTAITTGGYTSSAMYGTNLASAKSTIQDAFSDAVLTHREFLINAVTSGYPSEGAWTDSSIELMNEIMVFGSYIHTPAGNGSVIVKRYTNSNIQLALFKACPELMISGGGYWLRDVVSATDFARVDSYGGATTTSAENSYGIRPAFPIG